MRLSACFGYACNIPRTKLICRMQCASIWNRAFLGKRGCAGTTQPSLALDSGVRGFSIVREIWAFTRFGGDLLSRGLSPSTIGAAVLNFRVRYGTGCFTCAMTTKPRKSPRRDFCEAKARRAGGSVFACECAVLHGCVNQSTPSLFAQQKRRAGGSVFVYECAFPRLSHPLSSLVYAFGLV